uniref:Integrase catalytic domain-containing protein n=1 Tax=Tanacetum cinerariifolium TaxID=118510 RepID=A0A6L2NS05_TANCI|nr:hypothetical protein [Tanacetum cinerariifolium]
MEKIFVCGACKKLVGEGVNSVKQIHTIVDGKVVVISESSVRSDILFNDEDGRNDDKTEELNLTDGADTKVIVEGKGSGEKGGSTANQVSTARPEVYTASVPVNDSAATPSTSPTTTTIFGKYTHQQLKHKTLEELQKLYQKEQKWIKDFVPMDSEKEEKKSVEPESKDGALLEPYRLSDMESDTEWKWSYLCHNRYKWNDQRERKARTTLLMALPEDHLAKFYKMVDAKEIWEAIKSRFGGNDESKKMQKYLLKQQFEGFSVSTSEGIHKGYDRFRTLFSQLEIHGVGVSYEDANQKFLSTNDVSTAYSVSSPSVSKSQKKGSSSYTDKVIHFFFANQSSAPQLDYDDLEQINDDDMEEMDLKCGMLQCNKIGHFARDCRAKGNQDSRRRDVGYNGNKTRDNGRRPAYQYDSKALVTIDREDIDWSGHVEEDAQNYVMMAYSSSNSGFDNKSVFMNKASDLENTSVNDRYADGMHVVPPTMTGNYMPSGPDVEIDYSKFTYGPKQTFVDESDSKHSKYASCKSDSSVETSTPMPEPVENASKVGGSIAFGGSNERITGKEKIKAGRLKFEDVYYMEELKHYNLFFVSQMCDKKNNVLFTDTDCLVLSPEFKLPNENQVLLKIPRQHNMYSFNLKNIDTTGDLACLFSKASIHESNKWHRRLGHVNFKNLNKLVMGNLFRGLPSKTFENDHTCVACQKGKQHKASYKAKTDETTPILKDFIRQSKNQFNHKVKTIRSDNGTEFKNNELIEFCGLKRIKREYSNARTPQQNRVAERKNRTLIEAARTMVLVTKPQNKTPYELLTENQANKSVGPEEANNTTSTQANDDQSANPEGIDLHEEHFVLPIWSAYSTIVKISGDKIEKNTDFKTCEKPVSQVQQIFLEELEKLKIQEKEANDAAKSLRKEATYDIQNANTSSTNLLNTVSTPLSTACPSRAFNDGELSYPDDPSMPHLEDIYAIPSEGIFTDSSYDDEGVISQALEDKSWVDAMQEELLQFQIQKVWILVDLPFIKKAIGAKWVYKNKKDERGVVVRNKAQLVSQGHWKEEGIDYDEVFAPVARIEAMRIFLAFSSYMGFIVYQMDVKSAFLYGTIIEEVYVSQLPSFVDPKFPNKVYKVVKALYGLHQAPKVWYATLSTFLSKVKQKEDGIFISQDKYVAKILKKLDFLNVKTASTLIETQKPLVKDEEVVDVDVHLYRYLKGQPKLGLWYPKVSLFDLEAYSDSDYAGANLDRKFTTGGFQFLGRRLISWQCKKQTIVATSTTEAQYVADNLVFHSKTKHIEIRHHFIRDAYEKKLTQVLKIHIDDNVADLLTKAFDVRSNTMASAIICLATNQKFNFSRYILLSLVKNIEVGVPFFMFPRFVQLLIDHQLGDMSHHKDIYDNPSLTNKVFADMKRVGAGFSGVVTALFDTMLVPAAKEVGLIQANVQSTTIPTEPSTSKPHKKHKSKKQQPQALKVPSPEPLPKHRLPSPSNDPLSGGQDSMKLKELIDLCAHLSKKVLELESEVIDIKYSSKERIEKLKGRVAKLEEENRILKDLHSVYSKADTAAPVVHKENHSNRGG